MSKYRTSTVEIQGMTCESCARHVERAIRGVEGVAQAAVPGWKSGRATLQAKAALDPEALERAVAEAGYKAIIEEEGDAEPGTASIAPQSGAKDHKHLMVVGGGSAGFAAAIKGAELGHAVTLVEAGTIGGTCVNVGCIPSKTLIRAMGHYHNAGQTPFRGVQTRAGVLEWEQVIAHKDELVAELRQDKYIDVLSSYPEITYLAGQARLTGGTGVGVDGAKYGPDKIVLATGASPWAPPISGLEDSGYLTSTTAMELTELPPSMLVLGANAVGLELAQTFSRAGVEVTVVEIEPRIAPFEDEAVSQALQDYLVEEGLRVITDYRTGKVEKEDGHFHLTGARNGEEMTFHAEQLLVATGRRPNTNNMGLEDAGVQLGEGGEIIVDETLQTTNPDIYASGDVTGQEMFVYTAAYGGGLAAENALTGASRRSETGYIPRVTFTDPQIASAGLTEDQAREEGHAVKSSTLAMEHVPRALAARDTRGLVKLVADADSDKLLGAHILAPEAGEMIQILSFALKLELTASHLRTTIFPYLTNVEAIKLAALAFEKDVAKLSCCAG